MKKERIALTLFLSCSLLLSSCQQREGKERSEESNITYQSEEKLLPTNSSDSADSLKDRQASDEVSFSSEQPATGAELPEESSEETPPREYADSDFTKSVTTGDMSYKIPPTWLSLYKKEQNPDNAIKMSRFQIPETDVQFDVNHIFLMNFLAEKRESGDLDDLIKTFVSYIIHARKKGVQVEKTEPWKGFPLYRIQGKGMRLTGERRYYLIRLLVGNQHLYAISLSFPKAPAAEEEKILDKILSTLTLSETKETIPQEKTKGNQP